MNKKELGDSNSPCQKVAKNFDPKEFRPDIRESATNLGETYATLLRQKFYPLDRWALPEYLGYQIVSATSDVISYKGWDSSFRLQEYKKDYLNTIPAAQKAAQLWAKHTLKVQENTLLRLIPRVKMPAFSEWIHKASRSIMIRVGSFEPTTQDVKEAAARRGVPTSTSKATERIELVREIARASPSTPAETLVMEAFIIRRQRVAFAVREEVDATKREDPALDKVLARDIRKEFGELLSVLFAHPRGVEMLAEYSKPSGAETDFAVKLIQDAAMATREFSDELCDNPDHIWRYPVLIIGGVTQLGLHDVYGFSEYIVAISKILSRSFAEEVINHLGLALLCVGLVFTGGAGAVVVITLDLALSGAGTALAYLREREQELASDASAFLPEGERLASSSGYKDTALAGATALISTIALLGKGKQLLSIKPRDPDNLPPVPSRGGGSKRQQLPVPEKKPDRERTSLQTQPRQQQQQITIEEIQDARGISNRNIEDRKTGEPLASDPGSNRGQITTTTAASRSTNGPILKSDNVNLNGDTARTGGIREIWAHRDADGTLKVQITGDMKPPLPRHDPATPNFNRLLPTGTQIKLNDYEISHLWGPGFGDEAFDGMMYAPREVNNMLQNLSVESRVRELQELARRQGGVTIQLTARAESYPLKTWRGHHILKKASYRFEVRFPDGTTQIIGEVDIKIPPPDSLGNFSGKPLIDARGGSAGIWSLF